MGKIIELTDKQNITFHSDALEILYGGAAGGGKTMLLLILAVKHCHHAHWHAIIFRRSYKMLEGAGGIMTSSYDIYPHLGGIPRENGRIWKFPSGSTVQFSHMQHKRSHYEHQGKEYTMIGFDELTQFSEDQYTYLFSRLRQGKGLPFSPMVVSTSNPEPGWVRDRWKPWIDGDIKEGEIGYRRKDGDTESETTKSDKKGFGRTFIRAGLDDNMHLDRDAYIRALGALSYVERMRLLGGDWYIQSTGGNVFKPEWLPVVDRFPIIGATTRMLRYWDIAATAKTKNNKPDYTASCLLQTDGVKLYMQFFRMQSTWMNVKKTITRFAETEQIPTYVEREPGASGKGLIEELQSSFRDLGLTLREDHKRISKLDSADILSSQAESGNVIIVHSPHVETESVINEFVSFPDGPNDDMVDAASGAARMAKKLKGLSLPRSRWSE